MAKFVVTFEESILTDVTVEAETEEQAKKIAEAQFESTLHASNFERQENNGFELINVEKL